MPSALKVNISSLGASSNGQPLRDLAHGLEPTPAPFFRVIRLSTVRVRQHQGMDLGPRLR